MSKVKAYLWAAAAAVVGLLGLLLLGKSRKLEEMRVKLKIKEIDGHLESLKTKLDKSKESASESEKKMRDALDSYKSSEWKPGDSGPQT